MLFEFIDVAYTFSILFIIVGALFFKKETAIWFKNLLTVSNHLLILYSWYLLYQFYQLLKFILSLNIKVDKIPKQPIQLGWFEIKFILLITLPYLFLSKKLARNIVLSLAMFVILQWNVIVMLYNSLFNQQATLDILFYMPYLAEFKILNYLCLFVAVYALLWLLKRLPSQQLK